jgi:hypothetical protein
MATETATPKETKKMAERNVQAIIAELEQLDKDYTAKKEKLTEELRGTYDQLSRFFGNESARGKKKTGASKPAAERHCDICDINGHDARAHRNQDPKKKFTAKELAEKGLA